MLHPIERPRQIVSERNDMIYWGPNENSISRLFHSNASQFERVGHKVQPMTHKRPDRFLVPAKFDGRRRTQPAGRWASFANNPGHGPPESPPSLSRNRDESVDYNELEMRSGRMLARDDYISQLPHGRLKVLAREEQLPAATPPPHHHQVAVRQASCSWLVASQDQRVLTTKAGRGS